MKRLILLILLIIPVLNAFADSEDSFLDELLEMSDFSFEEDTDNVEMLISDIRIQVEGSTRTAWIRSKLIIEEGKYYKEDKLLKLIQIQKTYFEETHLFYSVDVYILPDNDGAYILYVDVTDGFMQLYNFNPWDLMWGIRHLEKGDELLEVTLGYNTQSVSYDRPNLFDSPFSYYASLKHYYGNFMDGKINSFDLSTKLYYSHKIWFNAGIEALYKNYNLHSVSKGQHGKLGLFFDLFPKYPITKPVGFNLNLSGGKVISSIDNAWYGSIQTKVILKPKNHLSVELSSSFDFVTKSYDITLKPLTDNFRSPVKLDLKNYYLRSFIQLNYEDLFSWHLYFTDLTISPMFYYEIASSSDEVKDLGSDINNAFGCGVIIGFKTPVNLFFTFGVKMSVSNPINCGFLFSAKASIY